MAGRELRTPAGVRDPLLPAQRQTKAVSRPQIAVSSFYGSVFPAVQNLPLACRAVGLGSVAADTADLVGALGAAHPRATTHHRAGMHHPDRVGQRTLRADYPAAHR